MPPQGSGLKNRASDLFTGCQLGCWALLFPWILTAVVVWLFPRFSYGLVERWVCPPNSSIQVEGTASWLAAILTDDEEVEFPQVTCVNAEGTVVLRGDAWTNMLAYLRVAAIGILTFLSLEIGAVFLLSSKSRRSATPQVAVVVDPAQRATETLRRDISMMRNQRAVLLQGRPGSGAAGRGRIPISVGSAVLVFSFGCLLGALVVARGGPAFLLSGDIWGLVLLAGLILGLALLVTDVARALRLRSAAAEWDDQHQGEVQVLEAQIAARTEELQRLTRR